VYLPRWSALSTKAGNISAAESAAAGMGSLGMVGVAQLVERRLVVADVAGSSPVTHPK
jgi:hypothetical protein